MYTARAPFSGLLLFFKEDYETFVDYFPLFGTFFLSKE